MSHSASLGAPSTDELGRRVEEARRMVEIVCTDPTVSDALRKAVRTMMARVDGFRIPATKDFALTMLEEGIEKYREVKALISKL